MHSVAKRGITPIPETPDTDGDALPRVPRRFGKRMSAMVRAGACTRARQVNASAHTLPLLSFPLLALRQRCAYSLPSLNGTCLPSRD